jgi:hypothetical protein
MEGFGARTTRKGGLDSGDDGHERRADERGAVYAMGSGPVQLQDGDRVLCPEYWADADDDTGLKVEELRRGTENLTKWSR